MKMSADAAPFIPPQVAASQAVNPDEEEKKLEQWMSMGTKFIEKLGTWYAVNQDYRIFAVSDPSDKCAQNLKHCLDHSFKDHKHAQIITSDLT